MLNASYHPCQKLEKAFVILPLMITFISSQSIPTQAAEVMIQNEMGNHVPVVKIQDAQLQDDLSHVVPSSMDASPLSAPTVAKANATSNVITSQVRADGIPTLVAGWKAKDRMVDGWYIQNGGIWRTNADARATFSLDFEEDGLYQFEVTGRNIHGPLPDDYRRFQLHIYIDDRAVGSMSLLASDTEWISQKINLNITSPGVHEVSFEWQNDVWDRETKQDSNLWLRHLVVARADNGATSFIPSDGQETVVKAKEGVAKGHPSWRLQGDGVWNTNDDRELVYELDFQDVGLHTLKVKARNHLYSRLHESYTHFDLRVFIDGVDHGILQIEASDTEFLTGSLEFEIFESGIHQIELLWINDDWRPLMGRDANIWISELMISRNQFADALAYKEIFGLQFTGNDNRNWSQEHNERWLQGALERWYYILPNGEFYRWISETAEGMTEGDMLLGRFNPIYYDDFGWLEPPTSFAEAVNALAGGLDVNRDGDITESDLDLLEDTLRLNNYAVHNPIATEEAYQEFHQLYLFIQSIRGLLDITAPGNSQFVDAVPGMLQDYESLDVQLKSEALYQDTLRFVFAHHSNNIATEILTTDNRSIQFGLLRFLQFMKTFERDIYHGVVSEFLEQILVKDPAESSEQFQRRVDYVHAIWDKHDLVILHEHRMWATEPEDIDNQLDDLLDRFLRLDATGPFVDFGDMDMMVIADFVTYNKPPRGGFTYSFPMIVLDLRTSFDNFTHEYGHVIHNHEDLYPIVDSTYRELYDRSPCPDSPIRTPDCHRYTNRNHFEDFAFFYSAWVKRGAAVVQDSLDRAIGIGLDSPAPFYLERILFGLEYVWPLSEQGIELFTYNRETGKIESDFAAVTLNTEGQIDQIHLEGQNYQLNYDLDGKLISAEILP